MFYADDSYYTLFVWVLSREVEAGCGESGMGDGGERVEGGASVEGKEGEALVAEKAVYVAFGKVFFGQG